MIELIVFLTFFNVIVCDDDFFNSPVYKYRYETEDVMKSAASNIPVHGYQVVEGGYYPYELGHGGVGIGSAALHGGITGPGIGALSGPGLSGYVLKPVGLIGAGGYGGAEFTGAGLGGGLGFAGMFFFQ